jgi:hypothetical protein
MDLAQAHLKLLGYLPKGMPLHPKLHRLGSTVCDR